MLDADGSTDPAEIPRFVSALCNGADFVKGSRFAQGGSSADITRARGLGNHVLRTIVNTLYGTSYTDLCYGYNAFWARCLPYMRVDCDGFEVETLINVRIAKAGLIVHEVPSYETRSPARDEQPPRACRDGSRVLRTIVRERPVAASRRSLLPRIAYRLARIMRVALVASSFLPERGRLERRVDRLARGLAEARSRGGGPDPGPRPRLGPAP